ASMIVHMLSVRRFPGWEMAAFNRILLGISIAIILGFAHGVAEIGVTQWALAGRVLGWLVLLGYLGLGWMMFAYAGHHGMRRVALSMCATGAVIVLLQVAFRWLDQHGFMLFSSLAVGFNGYANNRNAFAF